MSLLSPHDTHAHASVSVASVDNWTETKQQVNGVQSHHNAINVQSFIEAGHAEFMTSKVVAKRQTSIRNFDYFRFESDDDDL